MAVDSSSKWHPLPEVSPAEDRWWQKENTKPFPDIRPSSLNKSSSFTPSCQSSVSVSTLTPPTSTGSDRHLPADLSISSLHTTTPLTMETSSTLTPYIYGSSRAVSQLTYETSHSHNRITRGVSDHRVKFVPQFESISEMEELWKKFLASSLVQENRGGIKCTCNCGAKKYTAKKQRDTRAKEVTSETDSTRSCPIPPPRMKSHSVLMERAVQTSPWPVTHQVEGRLCHDHTTHPTQRSPHDHTHIPHSASVAFTVTSPKPAGPQLGQLTLSEAFALSHPEFIEASLRRQREIKQRQKMHMEQQAYTSNATRKDSRRPHPSTHASIHTSHKLKSVDVASSLGLGWHPPRPKISKKDMYEASRRAWSQLPEVKAKVVAERRKSQAETNRLRVKLYQKEVLSRLRKHNKQKH